MSLFAVHREAGANWTEGIGAFDQPDVGAHAAFMNSLAEEGVILAAGPLAGSERGRIRVLLIAEGDSEAAIAQRLADDPWQVVERVVTTKIEPWTLVAGSLAEPQRQNGG